MKDEASVLRTSGPVFDMHKEAVNGLGSVSQGLVFRASDETRTRKAQHW